MAYKVGQVIKTVSGDEEFYEITANGQYIIKGTPENVLNTIHDNFGVYNLSHFGIQSRPGAIFAIDDEVIIIGRSGSYELSVDLVSVDKLYMLSKDTFIIDFRY